MTTYTVFRTCFDENHVQTDYRALVTTTSAFAAILVAEDMAINAQEEGLQRKYNVVETEDEIVGWVS